MRKKTSQIVNGCNGNDVFRLFDGTTGDYSSGHRVDGGKGNDFFDFGNSSVVLTGENGKHVFV